jgi:hypothetical protein
VCILSLSLKSRIIHRKWMWLGWLIRCPRRTNGFQGGGSESGTSRLHLIGHFRYDGIKIFWCWTLSFGEIAQFLPRRNFYRRQKVFNQMERFKISDDDKILRREIIRVWFGLAYPFFPESSDQDSLEHVTQGGRQWERGAVRRPEKCARRAVSSEPYGAVFFVTLTQMCDTLTPPS